MSQTNKPMSGSDKTLDTLIPDVYNLFNGGHTCDEKNVERLGHAIGKIVCDRLEGYRTAREQTLRISNLGKPDRQVWYEINDPEGGEKLPPQAKIKFLFGDIWEQVMLFLAAEAGHTVTDMQREVELEGVPGHPDARIDGVPVDVKSASTAAFKKFKDGSLRDNDPFGYMHQLAGYVEAEWPGSEGAFWAVDKTMGHMTLLRIDADELIALDARARAKHMQEVISSKEMPPRCFEPVDDGKSGNKVLGLNCSYCAQKFKCWSDANNGIGLRTFLYSTGPRHFVHVEKEPQVVEVTF